MSKIFHGYNIAILQYFFLKLCKLCQFSHAVSNWDDRVLFLYLFSFFSIAKFVYYPIGWNLAQYTNGNSNF